MPTYEFFCHACMRRFEMFLPRVIKEEEKVCPNCQSKEVKQIFSNEIQTNLNKLFGSDGGCGPSFGGFG